MVAIASQITSLASVYSTVYSDANQRKHQSSASLAFVRGIHRRPVNSPHKWPVTRKMFPFVDVNMNGIVNRQVCVYKRYYVHDGTYVMHNELYISPIESQKLSWIDSRALLPRSLPLLKWGNALCHATLPEFDMPRKIKRRQPFRQSVYHW